MCGGHTPPRCTLAPGCCTGRQVHTRFVLVPATGCFQKLRRLFTAPAIWFAYSLPWPARVHKLEVWSTWYYWDGGNFRRWILVKKLDHWVNAHGSKPCLQMYSKEISPVKVLSLWSHWTWGRGQKFWLCLLTEPCFFGCQLPRLFFKPLVFCYSNKTWKSRK